MALILVVDDETTIADMLTELLEECGHTPLCASNGAEALQLAYEHKPALIISDIMMPVMDGYALLRAVRETPALADTAVVLASAGVIYGVPEAASVAADGYMQKPFDLHAVESLLGYVNDSGEST